MQGSSPLGEKRDARSRLLLFAFAQLYGPFAWAYDWVSSTFFMGQWRLWQRASIPHLRGPRVLEIGMGTGDLQLDLGERGFQTYGIDFSPQMLGAARRKGVRRGEPFNMCRARAQALPFPDGAFTSVVSTFPTDYIVDPLTLREVARVLGPGGRLVVVPGGWLRPRDTKGWAMERVARLVYGYRRERNPSPDIAEQVRSRPGWFRWVSLFREHMGASVFEVEMRVAHNSRGACLLIIAKKG